MDFAMLPPEINSGRMYSGPGSSPMMAAASAWEDLAVELHSAAVSLSAVISGLTSEAWLGAASASMATAAGHYAAWLTATATQAEQTAAQARAAAAAYETAFAAMVPPPVIAENRALVRALVATNFLGQNSPMIAATEMQYAEMWAQDAAAMYEYAGASAAAAALTPFSPPPQNTTPAGIGAQAAAVRRAAETAGVTHGQTVVSQSMSAVPQILQRLASVGSSSAIAAPRSLTDPPSGLSTLGGVIGAIGEALTFGSGGMFLPTSILFLLGPLLQAPVAGAMSGSTLAEWYGSGVGSPAGVGPSGVGTSGWGGAGALAGQGGSAVLAGMGRAVAIGELSVPRSWALATPAVIHAAAPLPKVALVGLPQAGLDGLDPGFGGMIPAGLMAAAASGGGAAGGSWGAQRAGETAQGGAQADGRYASRFSALPQVAREPGRYGGRSGQWVSPDQQARDSERPLSKEVRDEIDDLRRQIAELAMERDVLMRSAALWAREAMGR
ncbi:PPE family protein [Mycobacterium sp. SM1]|uniref:PPE family protein n=1 Tax=Mycobacterium sp. SM1 TaxID=2816243 RepID=UPI001BD16798|nr:PPE family protein [Mycobacterium sp. SM1]MBS4730721.1 PPE family protein [Mycobacterium sp. SM1]